MPEMWHLLRLAQWSLTSHLEIREGIFPREKLSATGLNMTKVGVHTQSYMRTYVIDGCTLLTVYTERLDEIDSTSHQENEEALQDRLLQLFNLPITHTIPSLADIGDINQGSIGNAAQEELAEGSDFLTLDCRALAEALSTLPLHQRLDIDHELFTDENREGGMVSYSDSDSSQPATSSSRASLHKYKNVVFRRAGHEEDELDLTKSLKKYSDKKDDVRIECQYHVDFSLVESLKQTVASVKSVEASTEGSRQSASADDEEIELDKLLSRKMEAKPHSPKPGGLLKSKDDPQSSSNVATEIKSHAPTTVEDENTELDDMLDELLT